MRRRRMIISFSENRINLFSFSVEIDKKLHGYKSKLKIITSMENINIFVIDVDKRLRFKSCKFSHSNFSLRLLYRIYVLIFTINSPSTAIVSKYDYNKSFEMLKKTKTISVMILQVFSHVTKTLNISFVSGPIKKTGIINLYPN